MKNMKSKKWIPVTVIVSVLGLAALVLSIFLIIRPKNEQNTDAEPAQISGNLQGFDFPDFDLTWGRVAFPGEYNREKDIVVDYAYSDQYFDYDSSIYNPSLATMSLCLELSSWASYETDVWAEKTQNARKLLNEIGFEDFAQNEFWIDSPSTESIGVVAAHKELADCTLIALPVRGGKYYNEWGSNVAVGTTGAHTGFAQGRDNAVKFLEKYIVDHNITGRVKIWVVGYSRGGAVANMVAGYLNDNELPNGATLAFEDLYCYAFEPPQGALLEMTDENANYSNIHNIVNPNDIVPMVAPVDWDFARYNTTSRLLPTVTTAEFEKAFAVMLEQYEQILAGAEIPDSDAAAYNISEYAKRIDVSVNPLNFLPGGDPIVDIQIVDDTSQTMNEVLTQFITAFADSLEGRENYHAALEADLIYLLDQLMGYETGFEMDAVLATVREVMTANNGENLKYVLTPIFQINGASAEERTEQVVARLHEVLPQPEGFNDLYETAATLIEAVGTLLVHNPEELLDVALAFSSSKVMQAHYEEITLAWMRAGDPNYTDTPFTMAVPETLRIARLNCPVDVEIYDSEGNLVASITGQDAMTTNAVVGCSINENGEIIIHLPADAEYSIVTTATADGVGSITLSEYNVAHSNVTRVLNYTNIAVKKGDVFTLSAPDLSEKEYTDEKQQGSTTQYRLSGKDGETIPCQREDRGKEVKYFTVSVDQNNACGIVIGGGQYLDGTFAQVKAQTVANGSFIGWYRNGELVSTDTVYRFAVDKDTALTAHFAETAMYAVTFKMSGRGKVSNADHVYSAGSKVQLSAEAEEGYAFDHWETTAGTIENVSAAQTVLTVADSDAIITAVFQNKICPACHQGLTGGETHAAICGVEGHYTCDGGNHEVLACGHFACSGGNHGVLACGHFACSGGNHGKAPCRHFACDGGNHGKAPCGTDGHYVCDGGNHGAASCGTARHYACDGKDHSTVLPCGHLACADGNHEAASCGTAGHYLCDGGNHGNAACGTAGHYLCDDGNHGNAACGTAGHYACDDGDHGNAACGIAGHYACDGGDHTLYSDDVGNSCGHYRCDASVAGLNHSKRSEGCEHYLCDTAADTMDHSLCTTCGYNKCSSELPEGITHGTGSGSCYEWAYQTCKNCGVVTGDATAHYAGDCFGITGHYTCDPSTASLNHAPAECGVDGHYGCDGLDHTVCDVCGRRKCDGSEHGEGICNTAP